MKKKINQLILRGVVAIQDIIYLQFIRPSRIFNSKSD